jgi:hypothetical protein
MNETQLIEFAFLIKEEEDKELKNLLKKAEYQFIDLLMEYILLVETKIEVAFQTDYEELQEIIDKVIRKYKNKPPSEKHLKRAMKKRSFDSTMKNDIVPELEAAFFALLEAFKNEYDSDLPFDENSEAYKELKKWLKNLPEMLRETTDSAVNRELDKYYEKDDEEKKKGISLAELAVFGYVRARSIAILEILRMYGGSQYEAMMLNRHVIGSTWRHADGVKEPREAHVAADGLTAAKGEYFYINGTFIRYPRDPLAPIEETIYCHCWLDPIFDRSRNEIEYEIEKPPVD